jgi:hypothetical protein
MARYGDETTATDVGAIDVISLAPRVVASAYWKSAFMPGIQAQQMETRVGYFGQQEAAAWGTIDLDALDASGSANDEVDYVPTARTYTCTGHGLDKVLGQLAIIDGSYQKALEAQVVEEVGIGYAKYFDSLAAALFGEAITANELGSSASSLTGPLIDQGIEQLLSAGAPEPFHLVIRSNKIRELMQIPHMRDRAVRGAAGGGGIDGPNLQMNSSACLVKGYGGVLDVYHSPEIDVNSGTHNIMYAVGDGTNGAFANPFVPLYTASGRAAGKMHLEIVWNAQGRAREVIATTVEQVIGRVKTSTTNNWCCDLITAPAS